MKKQKKIDEKIPKTPCHIPSLQLSCWGCCGNNFESREEIEEDIKQNTFEFKKHFNAGKTRDDLKKFRDRFRSDEISPSGICFNLVELSHNCYGCPLHPLVQKSSKKENKDFKMDLREGHCDIHYECETYKYWKKQDNKKKSVFLEFIKQRSVDNYTYSIENGDDIMIKKFKSYLSKKETQVSYVLF